ncbi:hypothetical protein [Psychrobacter urativorans]|uniref:Uncharacterized protein n=1 Tax=Psychrobacter urativorans TaxID=45610 RepID=A0A0M4TDK6_9GAMM|nr:hypothetical protein [Psychrobacter urativorans]ALF58941.1 hypothetical protein AOC03_01825 [Psychrobacter urativorans]
MTINNSSLKLMFNNIAVFIVAIFTVFWLSACSVSPSSTGQTQTPVKEVNGSEQRNTPIDPLAYQGCVYPPSEMVQACAAQNGAFSQQGRRGCYQCVLSYADAGKVCQDASDCQGTCEHKGEFVAAGLSKQVGQCATDSSPFGCRQVIKKGVAQPAICVD